jgi:murein DD-endopeptidase MepM/ murein hydrolase activator NlpD
VESYLSKIKFSWLVFLIIFIVSFSLYQPLINIFRDEPAPVPEIMPLKSINNTIKQGETLFSIFTKYRLRTEELFEMKSAAANIHPLRELQPGNPYRFILDKQNNINSFTYEIDDNTIIKIERIDDCFRAHKFNIPYETHVLTIGGSIEDNLISAVGTDRENYLLALEVADIFKWDIDFNTDLRTGDTFRIIAEGLYLNGEFKKYGRILSVEFINNKTPHNAYLFENDGKMDYYNAEGQSLRKAFLKAPLSFRRISSSFSKNRRHPILKIYRPHQGIDYAAASGTPVSAVADGTVRFAGYKGNYGKLIIILHRNGYQTYYGHLSRIKSNVRKGKKVLQDDLIGYVGATGMATGPHLHYEMRMDKTPINPLSVKSIAGKPVPSAQMVEFKKLTHTMDKIFAVAIFYDTQNVERKNHYLQKALLAALKTQ